jgi:ADP-ribose pyrophosphatase
MRLRDLDADISHLRETTIASEQVWKGRLLDVRRDRVSLPDGHVAHREYIVHPGAVMVVAMLDAERLIVERQWRHPIGKALIEFPAGKLEAGEPVLACAVRELFEETGYRAAEWARAGITHNAIAYATEGIEIWFARGLTAGERQLDHGEFLDVLEATAEELEAAAGAGELTDAKTLIGLLWLRNWQAGRWSLQWQPAPP